MIKELNIIIVFLPLIIIFVKFLTKSYYNYKKFKEQLNWYRSYYGDEHTYFLKKELKTSLTPYKFLNEIIKNINPELVNEKIEE